MIWLVGTYIIIVHTWLSMVIILVIIKKLNEINEYNISNCNVIGTVLCKILNSLVVTA